MLRTIVGLPTPEILFGHDRVGDITAATAAHQNFAPGFFAPSRTATERAGLSWRVKIAVAKPAAPPPMIATFVGITRSHRITDTIFRHADFSGALGGSGGVARRAGRHADADAGAALTPSPAVRHLRRLGSLPAVPRATYERWTKTRMANVVTDPQVRPDAIIPDLSKPDPLVTFKRDDIAFVYGSKWKQRYFTKVGDDYFPLPAQWDVDATRCGAPTSSQPNTDWWVPYYPADNIERPTGPLCDGCHSVNYNVKTKTVTEWNVGCEKCHGPGSAARRSIRRARTIVNPARLDYVRAQRCLHSVPLPGAAAEESDRRAATTTGRSASTSGLDLQGLLETRGAQARRDDLHALRRRHRPQEPHAGQRLRPEPDVHPRRHVLSAVTTCTARRTTPI